MKPKTKLQFAVIDLSQHIIDIKSKMLSWAKVECLQHIGYATKNRVICMDCGERFSPELVNRKRAICPHCGQKLVIEQSRCTTNKQHKYIASAEIVDDFQVIRNFELFSYHKADRPTRYYISEILQHWILPNGKHEVVAQNHTCNYCDSWNGDMEIRKNYARFYYYANKYDVYPYKFHPQSEFKAEYLKLGINRNLQGITALEAIRNIPMNQKAETLLKSKQYSLLELSIDKNHKINSYWPSIKICMRNQYLIKDAKIYIDYLDLLNYFNKDLHNAFYVCPKDLNKEHDKLVAKKRIHQKKQDEENKRIKAIKDEEKFQKLKSQFFGIVFKDDLIQVKVLDSVLEFKEEGDALHHCVFTNEYYLNPDSIVFSATIEGKRIETVEVSLKQLKVVQSRGVCNKNTEYHDRIIELVNKNIKHIRKRTKQQQIA